MQLFPSISNESAKLKERLKQYIPESIPGANEVVSPVLEKTGKLLRPNLVLSVLKLLDPERGFVENDYLLAELTELMHTASLVHDDVIDNADTRRGEPTVYSAHGPKLAIIAGDYLFAQSSYNLSQIGLNEIGKLYSELLINLCNGEFQQSFERYNVKSLNWDQYIQKSFRKTASMFAIACKSAAILSEASLEQQNNLFEFGNNIGLAFQIIDDMIDFTSAEKTLGKPQMGDLRNGIYTAPVLFALESNSREKLINLLPESEQSSLDENSILDVLNCENCMERTHQLAQSYIEKAKVNLDSFVDSPYKTDLLNLSDFIVERKF